MTPDTGKIYHIYSAISGKFKFYICVTEANQYGVFGFLFLNSEDKFDGDLVLADGDIEGLPQSRTGLTIVCFSDLQRFKSQELILYQCEHKSDASPDVISKMCAHLKIVKTLTKTQKEAIRTGLKCSN